MSSIPPISEVTDALMHAVIPSFGATVAVGGILASLWGRRAGLLTAALAFASGILAGNFFRGCFVFGFQPDTVFRLTDLVRGIGSVILWQTPLVDSGESVSFYFPAAGRYWIPWAALMTTVSGIASSLYNRSRWIPHVIRILVSMMAARMVVPAGLTVTTPAVGLIVGIGIVLIWTIAEWRSARVPIGVTSAAAGLASLGAAAVLLHAHSARLTDIATLVAFATFGIAALAILGQGRLDPAGAGPATAVFLPGVLISGYHETFSSVPIFAFVLPALGVVSVGLLSFLPDRLIHGWRVWAIGVFLAGFPVALAVILASRYEALDFG